METIKNWWKSVLAWTVAVFLSFGGGYGVAINTSPAEMVVKKVEQAVQVNTPIPNKNTDKKETVKPQSSDWCKKVQQWYFYYKDVLTEDQMLAYAKSYGWRDIDIKRAKACIKT